MSPVRTAPGSTPSNAPRLASELRPDVRACVVGHEGDPAQCERLSALGLGVGAVFQVLRAGACMRLRVGESTLALGEGWATSLAVVEL
jgi:Fe2+ transport system protein FeoA